jgi:carboxyl-terminal processing protease
MLSENELNGAFKNPGRLGATTTDQTKSPAERKAAHSPPIKAELIGTPQDSQLKAALDHLEHNTACSGGTTNGAAARAGCN